jgi:holin-like protein
MDRGMRSILSKAHDDIFRTTIVGTVLFFNRIGQEWLVILVGLVFGVLSVLLVTGWVTTLLLKKEGER